MAKISLIDRMSEEEETVLSFYENHPGCTWVEAAEALGIDEVRAMEISVRLSMHWKALIMKFDPINPSTFEVKQLFPDEQQNLGDEKTPDGMPVRQFGFSQ